MVGLWSLETGLGWSFGSPQFRDGEKWQMGGMTEGECRVRDFARRAPGGTQNEKSTNTKWREISSFAG